MPFITLNNDWSNLAQYYNNVGSNGSFTGTSVTPNVTNTQKPNIPPTLEQFSLSDEGLIRGGAQNALLAVTKDVFRIGKFIIPSKQTSASSANTGYERFIDNTKGFLFLTKQFLLQRANPRLEKNKETLLGGIAAALGGPTRTYTGVGLLASVGGTAFGLHFDRAGVLGVIPDNQKYGGDVDSPVGGVVYSNNFNDSNKIINDSSQNRLLEYTYKLISSKDNEVVLDSYLGGPNSLYGIIGRTRTKSYFNRTFIRDEDIKLLSSRLNGFVPLTNKTINDYKPVNSNSLRTVLAASPFYNKANSYGSTLKTNTNNNIESRLGVSTINNVDSINIINIVDSKVFYEDFKGKSNSEATTALSVNTGVDGDFGKDLIKFRIEFLNNDETGYKDGGGRIAPKTDVLAFRAYIDDFSDGMAAKWNSYKYMGRGEEFYVYDGFSRDISVSFTMFAHTEYEIAPLYSKLNYLMSTFTPDYSSKLKMRGNIAYLTVGDYLYRQPGVFSDIKIGGFFDGPWNVGLDIDSNDQKFSDNYDKNLGDGELPMMLKVSLSFKPIHSFLPRKSKYKNGSIDGLYVPFIGRDLQAYPLKSAPSSQPSNNPASAGGTNAAPNTNATSNVNADVLINNKPSKNKLAGKSPLSSNIKTSPNVPGYRDPNIPLNPNRGVGPLTFSQASPLQTTSSPNASFNTFLQSLKTKNSSGGLGPLIGGR